MPSTTFLNSISAFFPWGFIKVCVLLLIFIYILFTLVIVRQERLMSRVVEIPFIPILRWVAVGHFIAAVSIMLIAIIVL